MATSCPSPSSSSSAAAAAAAARSLGLFYETPLLLSKPLSALVGAPVYLKMDALQPSGSFKDRGMAHLFVTLSERGASKFVSSSGGNAGLAAATVGAALGAAVEVVVPETTKPLIVEKLRRLGADVTVHGANWNAADELARERVRADEAAEYVSPYDNPLLWEGHSSIVDELAASPVFSATKHASEGGEEARGASMTHPSHIVASVGGGGLLCGILEGLKRQSEGGQGREGWAKGVGVVAAETEGAASFAAAWEAGGAVRLDGIHSIATSLGALQVSRWASEALGRGAGNHVRNGRVAWVAQSGSVEVGGWLAGCLAAGSRCAFAKMPLLTDGLSDSDCV